MDLKDFDYDLPEELIAQDPLKDRSASRLLVLDKSTGQIRHGHFTDVLLYLEPGDCLVINDTKVIPARLLGVKPQTGAHVEVFLLKRLTGDTWECLVRPGKKLKSGTEVEFGDGLLKAVIEDVQETGNRIVRFVYEGIFEELLDRLGEMPVPPYIHHKLEDRDRYQTVYAVHKGSAAAPTAGLHFTKELLEQIEAKGIDIARITLHVGLGTFRPVKTEQIEEHHMHSEYYEVNEEAAGKINRAVLNGHRIVSVGTTSTRTLESAAVPNEGPQALKRADGSIPRYLIRPCAGDTEIFIYPGYEWKLVDRLITNFHLPQSTLIMLVSALAGREPVLEAYRQAVEARYRFFSFGDAMMIV